MKIEVFSDLFKLRNACLRNSWGVGVGVHKWPSGREIPRGWEVKTKEPSMGGYGYFLEPHISTECRMKVRFVTKPIWSSSKVSLANQNYTSSSGKWRLYQIDLSCVSKQLYMCIKTTSICIKTTLYQNDRKPPDYFNTLKTALEQGTRWCFMRNGFN